MLFFFLLLYLFIYLFIPSFVLFRRAWSHKSLGAYTQAGEDFETAKRLRIDDPNFHVDYKKIASLEYMSIDSEPDISLEFPVLLPPLGGAF